MIQRYFFILRISAPCFLLAIFLSVFLFIPNSLFCQDQINVLFSSIDTTLCDTTAAFPYPVLSYIEILYKDANTKGTYPLHGLAAKDRWLVSGDTTEKGELIDFVWNKLEEYHQEDDMIPMLRNIKEPDESVVKRDPTWAIKEVADSVGTSVVLAMDYSGSMDDFSRLEDAARVYVELMSGNDRTAIIKFTDTVDVFLDFTNNKNSLRSAISDMPPDADGSPIWDVLYRSITQCADEPGYLAVVIFTDGVNSIGSYSTNYSMQQVISHANLNKVKIYPIPLGGWTEADLIDGVPATEYYPSLLLNLANKTGGIYTKPWKANPSRADYEQIYYNIYKEISAYYVLAHHTTDPRPDSTWRVVDVTVRSEYGGINFQEQGTGLYQAPFIPIDLHIQKEVTCPDLYNDSLCYAMVGDTVFYTLQIENTGPVAAYYTDIFDSPPDSLDLFDFIPDPDTTLHDTLKWTIPIINSGESAIIRYKARVKGPMPMHNAPAMLTNFAHIFCPNDLNEANNQDSATVFAFGQPDFRPDLKDLEGAQSPGEDLNLSATIFNEGNTNWLESIAIGFFMDDPESEPICTATIQNLNIGESKVVQGVWKELPPGVHMLYVKADWNDQIPEINEENNVDSDDVTVQIDTLIVRVSDIFYSVDVDSDPGTFPDITDYVTVTEQNYYTISGMADPAYWDKALEYHEADPTIPQNKDVMPGIKIEEIADTSITVIFAVDFTSEMNQSPWIVPSVMDSLITIFKSGDQGGVVGFRSSDNILQTLTEDPGLIDNAFNQVIPDYPRLIYDGLSRGISVAREQPGRNVILAVVAGEDEGSAKTMNMVFRESRKYGVPIYILHIHQNTPSDSLRVLADQSGGFYFGISDASGFYQKIEILNRIFRNFYQLQHVSSDTVQNETWRILELALAYNNTITGQDRGLYLAPNGPADVSIAKAAESKSMELIQGQMEWVVHSNDTVSYTITLQNMGHWDVYDIIIEDVLESNLVLLDNYDLEPDSQVGHTVRWVIDTLAFADTYQFSYHCSVETLFVQGPVPLVNKADLTAAQDDDSTNNTVSKTVYYIPPPPGNLVVTKKVVSIGNVPVESTTDTMWVDPLGTVAYQVTLFNEGGLPCRNIVVKDELPKELRVIDFTGTVDTTYDSNTNILSWTLNKLDSRIEKTFVYTCKEVTGGSPFIKALVNHVEGECDIDSNPDNNADSETVFLSRINIPDPEVSVSGHYGSPDDFVSQITIEPGDSVWIRIMTPIIVDSLALRIVFEDAVPPYEVDNYIDLNTIQLEAATPKILLPSFGDTEKRNDSEETQKVNVIFNTVSYWGPERLRDPRSDTAFVYIQSVDQFFLDRNTYKPGSEDPLQLEFMLSSNREVEIIIYDIAGGFVQRVAGPADGDYRAGWNFVNWNGTDKNNRMVGSGVYVAILMSGGFQKARKFIVIR